MFDAMLQSCLKGQRVQVITILLGDKIAYIKYVSLEISMHLQHCGLLSFYVTCSSLQLLRGNLNAGALRSKL